MTNPDRPGHIFSGICKKGTPTSLMKLGNKKISA